MTEAVQHREEVNATVRDAIPDDLNFFISTWLRSYKHSSFFTKRIRNPVYFKYHHDLVTGLLSRSRVTVAHAPGDPGLILSWLCWEQHPEAGPVIHYAYTRKSWRGLGLARKLFAASGLPENFSYTHATLDWWTHGGAKGLEEFFPHSQYNPYIVI